MKKSTKIFVYVILFLVFTASLWSKPTASEIMTNLDIMMDQQVDITSKVTLLQQKVKQGRKRIEFVFYRRDKDDSVVMLMLAPDAERGNGYLKVGDNFWMYRKNTRTFQHINRDESISGTDVKAGDMEKKKMTEQYKPESEEVEEEMLGKGDNAVPVYKFTTIAIEKDVTYPKEIYYVERDTFLPRMVLSYSLSGTLMNTSVYYEYTKIKGKYIMVKAKFVDEFEKGNVTVMQMEGISLKEIDDSVFTKAFLENASK